MRYVWCALCVFELSSARAVASPVAITISSVRARVRALLRLGELVNMRRIQTHCCSAAAAAAAVPAIARLLVAATAAVDMGHGDHQGLWARRSRRHCTRTICSTQYDAFQMLGTRTRTRVCHKSEQITQHDFCEHRSSRLCSPRPNACALVNQPADIERTERCSRV